MGAGRPPRRLASSRSEVLPTLPAGAYYAPASVNEQLLSDASMSNDESDQILSAVVKTEHLSDADWAELNRLNKIFVNQGIEAFSKALRDLASAEPARYLAISAAFMPQEVENSVRDYMAANGITAEELLEIIEKAEGKNTKH